MDCIDFCQKVRELKIEYNKEKGELYGIMNKPLCSLDINDEITEIKKQLAEKEKEFRKKKDEESKEKRKIEDKINILNRKIGLLDEKLRDAIQDTSDKKYEEYEIEPCFCYFDCDRRDYSDDECGRGCDCDQCTGVNP